MEFVFPDWPHGEDRRKSSFQAYHLSVALIS